MTFLAFLYSELIQKSFCAIQDCGATWELRYKNVDADWKLSLCLWKKLFPESKELSKSWQIP